ncbi:MAG: ABC transporter ATP-binding protein [Selenomonadaceae bacterium]|nr:ABC transporter ATP-binding protein [Selenomonadaceae bacterium]
MNKTENNSETIVEFRHITKRFPGIVANDDINLAVKKGEIFALLGENGAGKSVLMSILFGMYEAEEGEIYIRGKKEQIDSPIKAAALNIGMVHQHFKLVENFTIAENIIMGAEPMKKAAGLFPVVDIDYANEKIAALSKEYGLEVDPTARIDEVPVAVQQRAEILKMLYRDAEILIFDEPTAVLAPKEIEYLLDIIRRLRDGGKTIFLVTHKLKEIKAIADRCGIMRRGKLISVHSVADTDLQELANLMVGHKIELTLDKKPPAFGENILTVEHLTVTDRNKLPVVNDISLSIRAGEIYAIAGVSGNGQLEIADAVAGMITPTAGRITLQGQDITGCTVRRRTEAGIAYIPEDRQRVAVVMDMTLRDNMVLKSYYRPPFADGLFRDTAAADTYTAAALEKYDVRSGQDGDSIMRTLSGGNQQKAVIGRETDLDAALMIFVQPTRGVDIGAIMNIRRLMLDLRDKGKAILLISMELEEIMACADTIGVIYGGEIKKTAPREEWTIEKIGEYMMGLGERSKANE